MKLTRPVVLKVHEDSEADEADVGFLPFLPRDSSVYRAQLMIDEVKNRVAVKVCYSVNIQLYCLTVV